jgi:dihydroorotase
MYCLPILKHEQHRQALLQAAVSGNSKFFLGTDSAPHAVERKESSCGALSSDMCATYESVYSAGCAGIFTAHAAIELYAEAFETVGALDKLQGT